MGPSTGAVSWTPLSRYILGFDEHLVRGTAQQRHTDFRYVEPQKHKWLALDGAHLEAPAHDGAKQPPAYLEASAEQPLRGPQRRG